MSIEPAATNELPEAIRSMPSRRNNGMVASNTRAASRPHIPPQNGTCSDRDTATNAAAVSPLRLLVAIWEVNDSAAGSRAPSI
jgi:hypothetical protein